MQYQNTSKGNNALSIGVPELLYLIYFGIMFGARATGLYESQPYVYNVSLISGLSFFVLKFLATRQNIIEFLSTGLIMGVATLVYYNSGEKGLILCFSMMLGMKAVKSERVVRLALMILSISFCILHVLSVFNIIDEVNYMNKRENYGYVLRHSLGYPYPNTAHTTFIILVMLIMFLYKAANLRKLLIVSAVFMFINIYLYFSTYSRTGLLSVAIYLLVNIYFYVRKNRSKVENALIILLFPAIVIFSIVGPLLASGEVFTFMDKLLHKRYQYALYFLQNERITLFGSRFGKAPTDWYMIDNSFLYLFLQLGIVAFVIICALYMCWIVTMVKENRTAELAIMITFCMTGMSDPFLFNLSYKNITFIFIGAWFFKTTGKMVENLPAFCSREFCLIDFHNSSVSMSFNPYEFYNYHVQNIMGCIKTSAKSYLIVFAVTVLATFTVYHVFVPQPKKMYVDEATVNPYYSHNPVEMTVEDIAEQIEAGNYIEADTKKAATLYEFKGTAPKTEYLRLGTCYSMMAGFLLSTIAVIFKRKRQS